MQCMEWRTDKTMRCPQRDVTVNTVRCCLTGSKLQEYTSHVPYLLVKQNSYHVIIQFLTYSSLDREFNTIQIRGEKPV
jgi:hypothetical protein